MGTGVGKTLEAPNLSKYNGLTSGVKLYGLQPCPDKLDKMAHPKSRGSKQRKHKRRTHFKISAPNVATCAVTGERHLMHHAYNDAEGNLYYRGKILVKAGVGEE